MKNIILIAAITIFGFTACDTPSPATQNPDDPKTQTIPAPDSAKLDSTRNR